MWVWMTVWLSVLALWRAGDLSRVYPALWATLIKISGREWMDGVKSVHNFNFHWCPMPVGRPHHKWMPLIITCLSNQSTCWGSVRHFWANIFCSINAYVSWCVPNKDKTKKSHHCRTGCFFSSRSHGAFLFDSWNIIKNLCSWNARF